jgi:phenylacetate-CoA ligase
MRFAARIRGIVSLVDSSRWSRAELENFQSECLRSLAKHAFENVPYYRELFQRHGIQPEEIGGIHDLDRLPIASRAEIQDRPTSDVVARGLKADRLIPHRTGGSTGAPLTIRRTWFEERLLHAIRLKQQMKLGLRPTDMRAGVSIGKRIGSRWELPHTRLGLFRKQWADCLLPARDLLARLADIQADVVSFYPGSLAWISGEATAEDRRRIRPRLIVTGSETLTGDMRRQITGCFGAPVYDFYAAHEFNVIAYECRMTGLYHVSESSVIAEILSDSRPVGPGESGELIGTALHSYAMPFLRYRLGDVVTKGPSRCPCGAQCSTIQSILGRSTDRFPLPGGSTIHPYRLIGPLSQHDVPWVRRYQIIQETIDRILVKVVPCAGSAPRQEELARVRGQLAERVGCAVTVTVELVREIPPAANGKFLPYYSLVGGPQGADSTTT